MEIKIQSFIILTYITSLFFLSSAQKCSNYKFSTNKVYKSCTDLPFLNSYLHWNYISSTKKIEIAYRAPKTSNGWIAWGINPAGKTMTGSQVLVSFTHSNGSLIAYPTQLKSYSPSMKPQSLSFPVENLSTESLNKEVIIFAVLGSLGNKQGGSTTSTINHVWQAGTVSNDVPQAHPTNGDNVQSHGTLDFVSG